MRGNEFGYVVEVQPEITKVKIGRHSDCKNCGACSGSNNIIISVNNPIGAKVGEKVCIEMKENKLIQSVYIVYIQPLLFVFIGALIGYLIAGYINQSAILFEIIFGVVFFIISIIIIKITDKKVENNINSIPTITKIIS